MGEKLIVTVVLCLERLRNEINLAKRKHHLGGVVFSKRKGKNVGGNNE